MLNKTLKKIGVGTAAAAGSVAAFAQTAPTSAAQLAQSVDLTDMTAALFAVAGVILAFTVIAKGVSLVIGFVRRG